VEKGEGVLLLARKVLSFFCFELRKGMKTSNSIRYEFSYLTMISNGFKLKNCDDILKTSSLVNVTPFMGAPVTSGKERGYKYKLKRGGQVMEISGESVTNGKGRGGLFLARGSMSMMSVELG